MTQAYHTRNVVRKKKGCTVALEDCHCVTCKMYHTSAFYAMQTLLFLI
jgi:hypothetical protein